MPIQIALARFIEQGGDIRGLYPYWYLGTTPYYYVSGPFIPAFIVLLHRLMPDFSLFTIMFGIIGVVWLIGGIGVYLLVRELRVDKGELAPLRPSGFAWGVGFLYLLGPIMPFLFRFTDGVYLIAFSFLPLTLLKYLKLLKHWTKKEAIITGLMMSFVILLDSLIIPALIIGMISLLLAQGGWDHIESKIKKSILLFTFSILISTVWYTPGYWFTLLGAPSLAGEGLFKVIASLGKLIPISLALAAAIFSIRMFKKREMLRDFSFYWFFIFGFLSFLRFLSDPDFWLDWSAYGLEIQFGMAIILAQALLKTKHLILKTLYILAYLLLFVFVFNKYVLGTLQKDITNSVEYKISKQLEARVKERESERARVLLSGSTVFWLNAFMDVTQVRGGVDQASKDGSWRKEVWEIREGEDGQKAMEALRRLGVKYLVVHTEESLEYYNDFKFPYKFENLAGLEKIYEEGGDIIYRIMN